MSAWTIYLILQLDAINNAFFWIPFAVMVGIFAIAAISDGDAVWCEEKNAFYRWPKVVASAAGAMLFISIFIPPTKTAAAMVVIPAIVNNEALKAEAGDLYQLAKQALREAVTDRPEAK